MIHKPCDFTRCVNNKEAVVRRDGKEPVGSVFSENGMNLDLLTGLNQERFTEWLQDQTHDLRAFVLKRKDEASVCHLRADLFLVPPNV